MELTPTIASYSGTSFRAIQQLLDAQRLNVVAQVVSGPVERKKLESHTCDELIEMHVFKQEGKLVRLDTAVFLEADIERINQEALTWGRKLAQQVTCTAAPLQDEPAMVKNFVVGMLAINQGLGRLLREKQATLRWDQYTGRYAQTKVDFDEVCPAQLALGPDSLNKIILRGSRFTAVFTGPGGRSYLLPASGKDEAYIWDVNKFLTDAFAMLLRGEIENSWLSAAAEKAGLTRDGQPETVVLNEAMMEIYLPVFEQVMEVTYAFYERILKEMNDLLLSTTSGRQGVPAENMMLHLWRYLRRALAQELYASGFFSDHIPEDGRITIFYENDVPVFEKLLG